jgi:hypothetical protein
LYVLVRVPFKNRHNNILRQVTLEEKNIKPLYEELKGIQEELPIGSATQEYLKVWDSSVWEGYFKVLDLLAEETKEDFSRFKIEPQRSSNGYSVNLLSMRQCVSKAIKYIGSKYLNQEFNDAKGGGIVISQTQSQKQDLYVSISLSLQEKIINTLKDENISDKEKSFLDS